jgi:hypothetical protein
MKSFPEWTVPTQWWRPWQYATAAAALVIGACSATPSPKATECIARYQSCSLTAKDMPDYLACRSAVDADCLPQKDGGAP